MVQGKNRRNRLTAKLKDDTGIIELVWFQSVKYIEPVVKIGTEFLAYGRLNVFNGKKSIVHPELEVFNPSEMKSKTLEPIYASTEKLNARGLDSKNQRKIMVKLFELVKPSDIPENLPESILKRLKLLDRFEAFKNIHFPKNVEHHVAANNRLKFEEVFFFQLKMLFSKNLRKDKFLGLVFEKVGDNFSRFFNEKLEFELTNAQKRVVKEIRKDLGSGQQMNRLLQGDVGSGKTIVGLLAMLLALDNGFQAALMAPTEILAQQHYENILENLSGLGLRTAFLSGSVKGNKRKELLHLLKEGEIDILIGTHALIEAPVVFKKLGLAIIDEQHRFGVVQRAKLWKKNEDKPPHVLVMTATPIPRTLAMTVYGDLDVSVIDELPPGRKPVKTIHRTDKHRAQVLQFMHEEIKKGRQIYVVFPLIEESSKLDLANLQQGYEDLLHYFPRPKFQISVVHGRMKAKDKDAEMQRFVNKTTQIMVATTVIEVGVNVPNASVMVIMNTERFGLSQLHQLRGRVGRGADQSYCLLVSGYKLTKVAKQRIKTMTSTNNGFEIAEADLKLRGPGDMLGLRQSGVLLFRLLNVVQDQAILKTARHLALTILEEDPMLENIKNIKLKNHLFAIRNQQKDWGRIS